VRLVEGSTPDTGATPDVQVLAGGGLGLAVDPAPIAATDMAPPVLMSAAWYDGSNAGVSPGDSVYLTFSEPVTSNNAQAADFGLPVAGDTFGAGASVANGQNQQNPNMLTLTLQGQPLLTPGGVYSPDALVAGSPTGVYVENGSNIVDAAGNTALVQTVATGVDLQPGTITVGVCWDDLTISYRNWEIPSGALGGTYYALDAFQPNGLVLRNNGNVRERFTLSCSGASPAGWTLAPAAGQDQFAMKVDNSGPPYGSYTLDLSAGPQDIVRHIYSGQNKPFDLQLVLPTGLSMGNGVEQTITVTVTATMD
jgi:hypothetical protein